MALVMDKQDIKTLFSKEEIDTRIKELAKTISEDYKDVEDLVVVGVLKGALLFTADLIRALDVPVQLEFVRLASYGSGTTSSGKIKTYDMSLPDLAGRNVLVAEDIVDSGRTADFILDFLNKQAGVKSIKLVSLLDKPCRRLDEFKDIHPDYSCFTIEDKFVVGYGLDYDQNFRDLPFIGYVEV